MDDKRARTRRTQSTRQVHPGLRYRTGILSLFSACLLNSFAAAASPLQLAYIDRDGGFRVPLIDPEARIASALTEEARNGDADAQFSLGVRYTLGRGVEQDYSQAARWLRRAADQGHAEAQNDLGVLYFEGRGVAQDYREARRWYQMAARQGDVRAQFNLGAVYCRGLGVPPDCHQGARWIRKAARKDPHAQQALGILYAQGQGVAQDYAQAYLWLSLAAAQGSTEAVQLLREVNRRMSPAEIARARQLVRSWRAHAERDSRE